MDALPRRTYVIDIDQMREAAIAERFARIIGGHQFKIGADQVDRQKPRLDRAFICGGVIAGMAEVKAYTIAFGWYPTFKISKRKIDNGRMVQGLLRIPVWVVAEFSCRTLAWLDMQEPYEIEQGWGRTDRNDPADLETAAVFEWEQFNRV